MCCHKKEKIQMEWEIDDDFIESSALRLLFGDDIGIRYDLF